MPNHRTTTPLPTVEPGLHRVSTSNAGGGFVKAHASGTGWSVVPQHAASFLSLDSALAWAAHVSRNENIATVWHGANLADPIARFTDGFNNADDNLLHRPLHVGNGYDGKVVCEYCGVEMHYTGDGYGGTYDADDDPICHA